MRFVRAILLSLLFLPAVAAAQLTQPQSANQGGSTPTAAPVNPQPQSPNLRILTPVAGQNLESNFIEVHYELVNPAVAQGDPNFLVQMDGGDPVHTTTSDYTFTGLAPGPHTVTVTLVDANDTPIAGARAAVQFAVGQIGANRQKKPGQPTNTAPARSGASPQQRSSASKKAGMAANVVPAELRPDSEQESGVTSTAGSPLPIVSVIGFGILIGGVASALKTR